jgi:hypothetical protein
MKKSKIREYISWKSYPIVFILMGWFFFVMSIKMIYKVEGWRWIVIGLFPIVWYMSFWVGVFFEWISFKVVDLMIYLTGKNLEIKKGE